MFWNVSKNFEIFQILPSESSEDDFLLVADPAATGDALCWVYNRRVWADGTGITTTGGDGIDGIGSVWVVVWVVIGVKVVVVVVCAAAWVFGEPK